MQKLLITLALLASVCIGSSADFPAAWINNTQAATLLSATTNQTGTAVYIEPNNLHTFQIANTTLKTNTCYLDFSLDGTVWTPVYTNTFTAISSATTTIQAKWVWVRGRLDGLNGTNCTVSFKYLGGK